MIRFHLFLFLSLSLSLSLFLSFLLNKNKTRCLLFLGFPSIYLYRTRASSIHLYGWQLFSCFSFLLPRWPLWRWGRVAREGGQGGRPGREGEILFRSLILFRILWTRIQFLKADEEISGIFFPYPFFCMFCGSFCLNSVSFSRCWFCFGFWRVMKIRLGFLCQDSILDWSLSCWNPYRDRTAFGAWWNLNKFKRIAKKRCRENVRIESSCFTFHLQPRRILPALQMNRSNPTHCTKIKSQPVNQAMNIHRLIIVWGRGRGRGRENRGRLTN